MRGKMNTALHLEEPNITLQQEKPIFSVLLDCLLSILLLSGLFHCCVNMYRITIPEFLPLLILCVLAVLVQLCLHWCKGGFIILLLLGVIWTTVLVQKIQAAACGTLLTINLALDTLSTASRGQYDFNTLSVRTVIGYTDAECILLFMLLLFTLLTVIFALLIHYRMALLSTLLCFALLTPALFMSIAPPVKGIIPIVSTCAALFALRFRSRISAPRAAVRRGWFALPAALLIAGILCSMLHPESYVRPQQLENLRFSFENAVNNLSPKHAYGGLANSVSRVNMKNTESVSFSGKTMLRVATASQEAQYLKSFTGTQYSDSSWSLSDGKAYNSFLQNASLKNNSYLQNNIQTLMSQYESLKRTAYNLNPRADSKISIENVAANSRCIFVPYGFCSLPDGAEYDRDLRVRFSSLFGKNSYTIPFYSCSDDSRLGTYAANGNIAAHTTGSWPILTPARISFLITSNSGISLNLPNSLFTNTAAEFAWQTSSPISDAQREMLKLYSCQAAYNMISLRSGFQYIYTDSGKEGSQGAASYLLTQQDVDNILKKKQDPSLNINISIFESIDEATFKKNLKSYALMDMKQYYTQPLYPLTKKGTQVLQDTAQPIQLKAINSDIANFLEYEYQYRKAVYKENTQVPDSLRPTLTAWLKDHSLSPESVSPLASDSNGSAVNSVVRQVMQQLASSCQYTLSPGAPPAGTDFIDYFLNENKNGYCVHFATAATLLLRTLGIPARYAEGYYVPASELNGRAGNIVNVTDDRAHAWVEVYSPGLGWVPFEATPGYTTLSTQNNLASYATPSKSSHAPAVSSSKASASAVSSKTATASSAAVSSHTTSTASGSSAQITSKDSADSDLLWVIVCMAVLLAAVILLRHAWVLARRKKAFTQADTKAAGAAVYTYLQQLTDYGVPLGAEAQRLCEKALFSQEGLTAEEMRQLLSFTSAATQQALAKHGAWGRFVLRWFENIE